MAGLGDGIKYGKFSPSAVFSGGDAKEKKNIRGEEVGGESLSNMGEKEPGSLLFFIFIISVEVFDY